MNALSRLAHEVGVNERTLRRAVSEGAVRASRPSPRKLELPFAEARYVRSHWTLIAKLREALRTEHNVRFAMLFGSAARGDDTDRSDIDIVAELGDSSFDRVIDLSLKLEDTSGRSVDVVRLEDTEDDPMFLAMALDDARPLVDRSGVWRRLQRELPSLRQRGSRRDARRKHKALANLDRFLEERGWAKTA